MTDCIIYLIHIALTFATELRVCHVQFGDIRYHTEYQDGGLQIASF